MSGDEVEPGLQPTDGTVVAATVASGTLVPGETMFWGTVPGELAVAVDGQPVTVEKLGFKRRALYAPLKQRDLRVATHVYLELAAPVSAERPAHAVLRSWPMP